MKSISRSREMCEWEEFALFAPRFRAVLAQGVADRLSPFHLLSVPAITAQEQRACSELWTQSRRAASFVERERLAFQFELTPREKIRIAYFSNDFHDHATSLLLIETFEAHNRQRFEVHAFSFGANDGRKMRRRIESVFDVFHDVSGLSDALIARAIHAAGIDILIDLKGYTQGARTGVMMLRPAPVQVNYLGYPGTLGTGICDYIITDATVTPMTAMPDYSEAFAYMPHSYQPHGRSGEIGLAPARQEAGLPEHGFVFCCFNQAFKFTPAIFDMWCRLLNAVPDSVLWLLSSSRAEGNLRAEAMRRGVASNRLVFAPDMDQAGHLGRIQLAGLVLDTAPYGAHTTASDALFAGVPVVTYLGDTFPSRVASSLLHAIGLPELIAADEEDYLAIALTLAAEPDILDALKARLRHNCLTAPLFDAAFYTLALEDLYETMWKRRCLGASLAPIWALTDGHPTG